MSITFDGVSTAFTNLGTGLVITKPGNTINGNILVLVCSSDAAFEEFDNPAGFTAFQGNVENQKCFYKVAQNEGNEYTLVKNPGLVPVPISATMINIAGATGITYQAGDQLTFISPSAVFPNGLNDFLILLCAADDNESTYAISGYYHTPPTNFNSISRVPTTTGQSRAITASAYTNNNLTGVFQWGSSGGIEGTGGASSKLWTIGFGGISDSIGFGTGSYGSAYNNSSILIAMM